MPLSPQIAYENLAQLEQVDVVKSAFYRQLANEILADTRISLRWRQAIADRLNSENNLLAMQAIGDKDDSY